MERLGKWCVAGGGGGFLSHEKKKILSKKKKKTKGTTTVVGIRQSRRDYGVARWVTDLDTARVGFGRLC